MRSDVERVIEIRQPSRYFNQQFRAHGTRITGMVEGGERYDVGVDALDDGRLSCRCTCPYFVDRRVPCKHVVAFLLESMRRKSWTLPTKIVGIRADRARERGEHRDHERGHGRGHDRPRHDGSERRDRDARPDRGPPKPVLLFVAGDAWRSTLAPATTGAPAPLVYAYIPEIPGPPSTAFEFFRRYVGSSGIVQLAREPFQSVQAMELDPVDAQIVERVAAGDRRAMSGGPPDQSARIEVIAAAARAGRLHARLGHLSLGAAVKWDADIPRNAEIHIELTETGGAREWARLVAPDRAPIDCLRRATAVISGLFWLDDLIVAAPWSGTSQTADRWASGMRFGSRRNRLVMHGQRIYSSEELPELVRGLRNETPEDLLRGERMSDVLQLDRRLGIEYFEATPIGVLRLDSSVRRSTVDVSALARYRDPTRPDVVVDRDPRDHCLIEDPKSPQPIVPRPDVRTEYAIEAEAQRVIRKARGMGERQWRIPRENLPQLVAAAGTAGLIVEMAKQPARPGGEWSLSVTSGTDWFQLNGSLETPEGPIPLAALVAAAKQSPDAIEILPLSDGTSVLVPAKLRAVLKRLAKLLERRDDDELKFDRSDVLLLDSILEHAEHRKDDAAFRLLRDRLQAFEAPHAIDAPKSFKGTLRDYQREGLGWFQALRQIQFGGCLADEMGLGKTVQILAMLAAVYSAPKPKPVATKGKKKAATKKPVKAALRPSLIVVPRSIVRNWLDEAGRFAPKLRVADLSHATRTLTDSTFAKCDVALVTYGTLLRDIDRLSKRRFEYVILDEAQAIKNPTARSSKAAKSLQAEHRLAMTGTPIENHLGELWSLMDFLNPGMANRLERLVGEGDAEDLEVVRRAVRPFLLRRTKRDVAKDLPDRIEQTIFCDMTDEQAEHYQSLLDRVRSDLLGKIDTVGLNRSKMEVLEGLLRLRQIACHPVLADKRRKDVGSGKLEALMPMLEESAEEGRKTLVFSQFTSFLALVRAELDERGIVYEYLDGATRDRADHVKRFNTDEGCSVFLLSLKAGGVGLNLQAAERVVLLDPWWNPAVEAQAIDRAHRIGQTRTVHAMRLVSAGTVEERVLELQKKKRDLADAIISSDDAGPLASMTKQDLEFLLDAKSTGKAKKKAKA
ncbi:MAG: DEAD/DEAH box helicase [Phycisphaerales bacterium]